MVKNTQNKRIKDWRIGITRVQRPIKRQRPVFRRIRSIQRTTPPIFNSTNMIKENTELENLVRVGSIVPKNATMTNVMTAGKIPKPVRALLILAMSNPYTGSTKAAMDAAYYLQSEINKKKEKMKKKIKH